MEYSGCCEGIASRVQEEGVAVADLMAGGAVEGAEAAVAAGVASGRAGVS